MGWSQKIDFEVFRGAAWVATLPVIHVPGRSERSCLSLRDRRGQQLIASELNEMQSDSFLIYVSVNGIPKEMQQTYCQSCSMGGAAGWIGSELGPLLLS